MEYFWYTLTSFCAVVRHRWSAFPPLVQLYLRGRLDTNYAFMLTVVESLSLSCLWQKLCIDVIGWLSHIRSSSFFVSASLSMNALFQLPKKQVHYHKVNRCLAKYSPRATTTNRITNRAPNKPAWPGPNWRKMPILGQIWSFLGKKSFFLLEKSKVLLPT